MGKDGYNREISFRKGQKMKKQIVMAILALGVLVFAGGCIPTTAEIQTLTDDVDKLMVNIDNYQEKFAEEIDRVQEDVVVVNEAIKEKADESALEQAKAGWDATKDFNPYYVPGALILALLGEGAALWKTNKKNTNLEKGINRVKGEAEPALAKTIHDTMKIYT